MDYRDRLKQVLEGREDNHILPFFWQHGEDEETLRQYVNVIHDSNCGAFCVESRPHPDFCGEKWWTDMDIIIDEAKKLGMKVWILDDSHFPTGFANGAMKDADPSLLRRSIVIKYIEMPENSDSLEIDIRDIGEADPWEPSQFESFVIKQDELEIRNDDRLLSVVAIKDGGDSADGLIDLTGLDENGKIVFSKPDGNGKWKIAVVHVTANRGPRRNYINMMDKESVKVLIDAVYEPHFKHYGDEFGKTIEGFFSDEPEIGNGHMYEMDKKIGELEDQAYSLNVEKRLKDKWGTDFDRFLPLIWNQNFDGDLQAKVRGDYMDAVTREVEECFSFQLGDWCRNHGVKYIGHLIEDNHQHTRTGSSLGHYFRGLAGQDWAGIDDIGGQILPQMEEIGPGDFMHPIRDGEFWHYTLGKLGGSMAAIDPLKNGNCMCELFGNYGWEEGVFLEKYIADHLIVRGVNEFVPHAFSPAPFPDEDCPPHFYAHGHNPQYRHFGSLMKYMNRAATLLSGGMPKIPVAILYNAEADWAGEAMFLQKPAIELYDNQIDYHFVPADIFTDEKYKTELSDKLIVNGHEYRAFIIPYMEYIPESAARAAAELLTKGCTVLFVDAIPKGTVENGQKDEALRKLKDVSATPLEKISDTLKAKGITDAELIPENNRIRIYHYDGMYMVINEAAETYKGKVIIPGNERTSVYDAWENKFVNTDISKADKGTEIGLTLEPRKSLFIVEDIGEDIIRKAGFVTERKGEKNDFSEGWIRSICRAAEYPAFAGAKSINLPDNLAQEEPRFSGFVRYEKDYEYDGMGNAILEITDAREGVEVFVNDMSLGIQIVPSYIYDLKPYLNEGVNKIRIEVATTLEREAVDFPSKWAAMGQGNKTPSVPSGICGIVNILK